MFGENGSLESFTKTTPDPASTVSIATPSIAGSFTVCSEPLSVTHVVQTCGGGGAIPLLDEVQAAAMLADTIAATNRRPRICNRMLLLSLTFAANQHAPCRF